MIIAPLTLILLCITGYGVTIFETLGGVSGGPLLTPLFSLIAGIQLKDAVVMSVVTTAGGGIVSALFFFKKRQKMSSNRYLVSYPFTRFFIVLGSNTSYIGFLLNYYLSNYIILALFIIMLIVLIIITFKKTYLQVKNSVRGRKKDNIIIVVDGMDVELPVTRLNQNDRPGEKWLDIVISMIFNLLNCGIIGVFSFYINSYELGWVVYLVQFVLMNIFSYLTYAHIKVAYQYGKKTNFNNIIGDTLWQDSIGIIKLVIAAWIVGIVSTMLGITGAIIVNPIFFAMQFPPDVVVATGSMISLFSSIISAIQYITTGGYYDWYLALLFIAGVVGSFTAMIIFYVFKRTLNTVITIINAIMLIAGLCLLIVYNIIQTI